jgi:hypothetical protein
VAYCVGMAKSGLKTQPDELWNGDPDFKFEASHGKADSGHVKGQETRRSVSGDG